MTVKTQPWNLAGGGQQDFTTPCDAGQKAISGGFDNPAGTAIAFDTRPSADGGGWILFLANASSSAAASGTLFAVWPELSARRGTIAGKAGRSSSRPPSGTRAVRFAVE